MHETWTTCFDDVFNEGHDLGAQIRAWAAQRRSLRVDLDAFKEIADRMKALEVAAMETAGGWSGEAVDTGIPTDNGVTDLVYKTTVEILATRFTNVLRAAGMSEGMAREVMASVMDEVADTVHEGIDDE